MTSRLEHIFLNRIYGKIPEEYRLVVVHEFVQAKLAVMIEENNERIAELDRVKKQLFGTKINSPVLEIESSGHITG